jgi:hypothetical protein
MTQGLYRLGQMTTIPPARRAPLTGVVAVLLLVGSLIVEGQPPDADAATEDVVRFYSENDARLLAATLIGGLAAAFLIWFGGSVFALRSAEGEPGRVSAIAFGGFLLAAAGLTMSFGFVFAAAQTVGEVPAEVTQTLAVLGALFFAPFAVGVLVALLASAVAILRHGARPRWLGHVTILIAVACVMSAGFGAAIAIAAWILATAVWVLIVSVVVFLRQTPTERASSPR